MYSLRTFARPANQATRSLASPSRAATSFLRLAPLAAAQSNCVRSFTRSAAALDGTTQDPSQLKPKNTPSTEDTEAQSELLETNYGQANMHKEQEPARNEALDDKKKGKGNQKQDPGDLSISNKNK